MAGASSRRAWSTTRRSRPCRRPSERNLDKAQAAARAHAPRQKVQAFGGVWTGLGWAGEDWSADTRVKAETLRTIAEATSRLPADFSPHPRIAKLVEGRRATVDRGEGIDWGCAEQLAYGSLLLEGSPVRLSGQDSVRGTFSHRHGVLFDAKTGTPYVPLNHLGAEQAPIELVNSPLSEVGVVGFEYGMASADPSRLVVWEAQFGDFANGAQVIVDQFIASGESKWQRMNGLTLLLPHGYEGQGPEHSSARVERFLSLCADDNMQVVNCTTPAQFFHVLRRQMHRPFRKPLIVMHPKSLLRHPAAVSTLAELADGTFQPLLPDPADIDPAEVRRVLLCSGKIFYALDEGRKERDARTVALLRLEQLYPFPAAELEAAFRRYPGRHPVPLGAGGAVQPGTLELRPVAHRGPARGGRPPTLRGPQGSRQPGDRQLQDPPGRGSGDRRRRLEASTRGAAAPVGRPGPTPERLAAEATRWPSRSGSPSSANRSPRV